MAKLLTWQIGKISQFCKNRLFFLIERIVWAHCILFYLLYHSFRNVYRFFFRSIQSSANTFSSKGRKKKWRIWVSILLPPACKAGALPFGLIPLPGKSGWLAGWFESFLCVNTHSACFEALIHVLTPSYFPSSLVSQFFVFAALGKWNILDNEKAISEKL